MPQGVRGWSIKQRLMDKVKIDETTGCWLWTGATNNIGYGMFRISKSDGMMTAHKAMYEDYYETKVPKGLCVIHTCSNYNCVNPEHLKVGTRQDVTDLMKANDKQQYFGNRRHTYSHCPHCGIYTTPAMMARWHDDKCKKKPLA